MSLLKTAANKGILITAFGGWWTMLNLGSNTDHTLNVTNVNKHVEKQLTNKKARAFPVSGTVKIKIFVFFTD